MNTRTLLVGLTCALFPVFSSANVLGASEATTSLTALVSDATVPVGAVGPGASELASFVLSAAALVVAGIALSRTGKHPHSRHII